MLDPDRWVVGVARSEQSRARYPSASGFVERDCAGGLTTATELSASRRPFIYFPLGHHLEQFHAHHRLQLYRLGHRTDYALETPAAAVARVSGGCRTTYL